jgi:glycosyltransferase involved in cell wall biosynthesis
MRYKNFTDYFPETLDVSAAQSLCETLKERDVFVYGIDIYGLSVMNNLRDLGGDIVCFVDPNPLKQSFTYFGKKVISPDKLPGLVNANGNNPAVIIALQPHSKPSADEIKASLISAGIAEEIIFSLAFSKADRPIPVPIDVDSEDISDFDIEKPLLPERFYKPCGISEDDKIGVFIKVYRAPAQYIIRAVGSLREQSYRNIKITLLANDCDTETLALLRKFKSADKRIDLVENPHNTWAIWQKETAAIYKKITDEFLSDCDYHFFCDNDDYYAPDFLEKTVSAMRKTKADVVCAGSYVYREDGPSGLYSFVPAFCEKHFSRDEMGKYLSEYGIHSPVMWGKLWSKKAIHLHFDFVLCGEDGGGTVITPETIWTDDYIYINHLFPALENVTVIPDICYFWTRRGASFSGSPDISSCFFSYAALLPFLEKYLADFAQKDDILKYLICHSGFYLGINLLIKQIQTKPGEVKTALLKIKKYADENYGEEISNAVKIKTDEIIKTIGD